ncbi:hypothetical protein ACFE04_018930 [Oxalis oulophora]
MGSREMDPTTQHHHQQPLLSSLVVRASDTDPDRGSGGRGGSVGRGGGDYEPGEVRRDPPPPYYRSDRYSDDAGVIAFLQKVCIGYLLDQIWVFDCNPLVSFVGPIDSVRDICETPTIIGAGLWY